jgi:hypothetical protein
MIGGDGVSGITDAMVAAIWVLDTAIEACLLGVDFVLVNNDFGLTNAQSPIGSPASNFTPKATYYGLLMLSIINSQNPFFALPNVAAGAS